MKIFYKEVDLRNILGYSNKTRYRFLYGFDIDIKNESIDQSCSELIDYRIKKSISVNG